MNDRLSGDEISGLKGRLDQLDASGKLGKWTIKVLRLIEANPNSGRPNSLAVAVLRKNGSSSTYENLRTSA